MSGARILVVEDEPQIQRSLRVNLEGKGYTVSSVGTAEQALTEIAARLPDVMLVDLMLPGMDGIELTRRVRSQHTVPLIVLSAISNEQRKVEALELGADDYVTKPFGMAELQARIKSVLRRWARAAGTEAVYSCCGLSVNFERREVTVDGEPAHLTPKEFELLKYMIEHSGKVLTQRMLLHAVWGPGYIDQAQYLRVFVGQLRKKIERSPAQPRFIITDPGVGYRFNCDGAS